MLCFRPQTREELFNLRHASARNVVERVIGVLKGRFDILQRAPQYDMEVQIRIPSALCALHNFIRRYDPDDITPDAEPKLQAFDGGEGSLGNGPANQDAREQANSRRDEIAQQMWEDYLNLRAAMGGLVV